MVSVTAVAAALPSLRLDRAAIAAAWGGAGGKGSVAVCADDEDVLTLGWAAADEVLRTAGVDAASVDLLAWGTSRPPFAEGPSSAMLAAAVGLPSTAGGYLLSGSPHSGIEALLAACDAVAAGSARRALVVVSEDPRPGLGSAWERQASAAAVALLVEPGDAGPAVLASRLTRSDPVLDRYRGADERETRDVYDARLYREEIFVPAVTEVAGAAAADADVTGWSLPDPDGRLGSVVARRLGVTSGGFPLGYAGAAAPVLGALEALASAGTVVVVGHGGGRTTAVTLRVTTGVPGAGAVVDPGGRTASYAEVLRLRGHLEASGEPVPMGVPPGSAMFVRGAREMLQLLGARCVDCATVMTPPSVHPRCLSCGGEKLEETALGRTGTVQTFVVNHTMPAPFVAPLPLAVIDLDDGARVMLQVTGGGDVQIGGRVRLVLRRYAVERGASVYGFKAELVREG